MKIEEDDGIVFHVNQMKTERITEDANYEGVRIKIPATLGRVRNVLQLDIGFGDIVIPKPKTMDFPVLLNMEQPRILTYSTESVIAENFEAMINLSILNSRMKDFYDIYILTCSESFEGRVLQEAIMETFERRSTTFEKEHPLFTEEFYQDPGRNIQWKAFLKRTDLASDLTFEIVMTRIQRFIEPMYSAILYENEFLKSWNFNVEKWE